MGLLDDAIREHLELKRRRGADPGEVARQQREALAPVAAVADPPWQGEPDDVAEHEDRGASAHAAVADGPTGPPQPAVDEHPTESHEQLPQGSAEPAHTVQETAEIDMQTVLDEGHGAVVEADSEPAAGAPGMSADDEFEWEAQAPAGELEDDLPREIPGQERMSFE